MAFDASLFTSSAKPLPVFLILDVSGSMSGSRISSLNTAVRTMIDEFKNTVAKEICINMCVIAFESQPRIHIPMTSIENIQWRDLIAGGGTNLDTALNLAKSLIEDKNIVPSRAYKPAVILVSDGEPFPGWEGPMRNFIQQGRSAKCDRMAMLIGEKNAAHVMTEFLKGTENQLFFAGDAKDISKFFKFVTMTTTTRTLSQTPNVTVAMPSFDPQNVIPATVVNTRMQTQVYSGPAPTVAVGSDTEEDDE